MSIAISEIKNPTGFWQKVSLIFQGFFSIVTTGQKEMIVDEAAAVLMIH
jgi:hypothetical protein